MLFELLRRISKWCSLLWVWAKRTVDVSKWTFCVMDSYLEGQRKVVSHAAVILAFFKFSAERNLKSREKYCQLQCFPWRYKDTVKVCYKFVPWPWAKQEVVYTSIERLNEQRKRRNESPEKNAAIWRIATSDVRSEISETVNFVWCLIDEFCSSWKLKK